MDIKLTTDWILLNLPHCYSCGEDGNVLLICNVQDKQHKWVSLALDTLDIEYETEARGKNNNLQYYFYTFKLETIKISSPDAYSEFSNMRKVVSIMEKDNYVPTLKKTYTFDECETFLNCNNVSDKNFTILAEHLCVSNIAEKIVGFLEKDKILYFHINNKLIQANETIKYLNHG
jgi:hypothetical protein